VPKSGATREVVLAVDQGTTNSKALLIDALGRVSSWGSAPVGVTAPAPGWVEQDAERIWASVLEAIARCLNGHEATIVGVCLSTQRESVVGWRASTGEPVGPLLGWQDRRTAGWCESSFDRAADTTVRSRTGLRIDAMFSAPKIRWLLDHLPVGTPVRDVLVGTVDSWLLWNLTGGAVHACEAGNASRTLLYDVIDLAWSDDLLDLFGVPRHVLPVVRASNGQFGKTADVPGLPDGLPILAVLADSHAALYGQGCTTAGMAKATYGTGSSVMTPIETFKAADSPVPVTLAWLTDRPTFAREGNILSSGATLDWASSLLTGGRVGDLTALAASVPDSSGVSLVPAFSGLGAPHWDRDAQAVISGMTQVTTAAHIARAAVDSVAHQICDVVEVIERDGNPVTVFRADGGVTVSDLVMQVQADLLGRRVEVAQIAEASALGVAQLGWLAIAPGEGWSTASTGRRQFEATLDAGDRQRRRSVWRREVARARFVPLLPPASSAPAP
jgi:glycerol kinase